MSALSRAQIGARLGPFAGAGLLAYALVPIGTEVEWGMYGLSLGLSIAVILGAIALPWEDLPRTARAALPLVYLVAVGLLRDAAGGTAGGVGICVMLPVFWLALHGTRPQLLLILAATVVYWVAPVVLVGGDAYPLYTLRSGGLFVVVGGIIGVTVQELVRAARQRESDLQQLATEREELAMRLEGLALTDPLTGVGNRRAWDIWSGEAVRRSLRSSQRFSIAILDLDRFKAYNDEHGHQQGDALLREAGHAWTAELRPGDRLARWGGEEFVVLFEDCGLEEAHDVVERLRALVPNGATCSAGLAEWDALESASETLERADAALYAAKAAGRDRSALAGTV
ncbi:MAG: hypothetical protein QOE28_43 [Solirubrobacteraceae bacterium]|nr:hypothetical protein [Solirubrobacteraceae bacterium]